MRILVITKRQYMNKDLLDDRFGRFREIPRMLARRGHRVTGLCLSYRPRSVGRHRDEAVEWQSVNALSLKGKGLAGFLLAVRRQAQKADVIWACSDSVYGILGLLAGRMTKTPVVFDIYDNFGNFLAGRLPLFEQLYYWAVRRSDAITCLSRPFAEFLRNRHAPRQRIVPVEFAVRKDLFREMDKTQCRARLGLPKGAIIVGTAGALYKIREVDLLLKAFEALRKEHPDVHLALAGPRDITIPRDNRIHDLGLLPFEAVPQFINCLDVAVVCYADDDFGKYCFPQKTREFMACNVPVIAAKVGSLKEIFKDRPEWLYKPGDLNSLADTLRLRLADRRTGYGHLPEWRDLAVEVETVMRAVSGSSTARPWR